MFEELAATDEAEEPTNLKSSFEGDTLHIYFLVINPFFYRKHL